MKLTNSDKQVLERPTVASFARPGAAVFGSHPTALMARRKDGEQDFPDDNLPPPPPHTTVSAPDFAMQFVPCLEAIPVPGLKDKVINAVKESVGADADVRYTCLDGSGRIGVWIRPAGSTQVGEARDRGMKLINVLQGGENFAVWINASHIRAKANEAFDASPKRIDHDGNAKSDGPVHLTGMTVTFDSSGKVVTSVTGFDETPWPDVDFTLSITDRFSISGSEIAVDSSTSLDTDTSWITVITGAFFVLGALVSPWFFIGAIGFGAERIFIATVDPGDRGGGAGSIAAKNIPREVYIEGGKKLVCQYQRVDVNEGGITAGGVAFVVDRDPICSVHGPAQIGVPDGTQSVQKNYQVVTDDLRGNLTIQWSGGTVLQQGQIATAIRFNTSNLLPDAALREFVRVVVTDEDGLQATAEETVSIHMNRSGDEPFPPVCRFKPWLPQCKV